MESKVELLQNFTDSLEKQGLDPAMSYIYKLMGNQSTSDPAPQILEKLSAVDHTLSIWIPKQNSSNNIL